jgi:hypothetical protein
MTEVTTEVRAERQLSFAHKHATARPECGGEFLRTGDFDDHDEDYDYVLRTSYLPEGYDSG